MQSLPGEGDSQSPNVPLLVKRRDYLECLAYLILSINLKMSGTVKIGF